MKTLLILSLIATSANAEKAMPQPPEGKVDYSECNPHAAGAMGTAAFFVGRLNDKGDLDVNPGNHDVAKSEKSEDGNRQTVVTWDGFGYNKTETTWVLAKRDGRPLSLDMNYDPASVFIAKGPDGSKNIGATNRYGFRDNKCFVKQSVFKKDNGKEVVTYDNQTCNEILFAAKDMSLKKVEECAMFFKKVEQAYKRGSERFAKAGQEMGIGMGMPGAPLVQGILMGPMMSISACVTARQFYGMKLTPEMKEMGGIPAEQTMAPEKKEGSPVTAE